MNSYKKTSAAHRRPCTEQLTNFHELFCGQNAIARWPGHGTAEFATGATTLL